MLWNRPRDLRSQPDPPERDAATGQWRRKTDAAPVQNMMRRDPATGQYCAGSLNVTALAADIAARKFREAEARRMVMEPDRLPHWSLWNRQVTARSVTSDILGDPDRGAAALPWAPPGIAERTNCELGALCEEGLSGAALAIAMLRGCRWPLGDPSAIDFHFCNEPRQGGSSYCGRHRASASARR
jgi:GcrA cell cycle regulator